MTETSIPKKTPRRSLNQPPARPIKLWHDHQEQEVRIEIVPLIDVIFCILTFFILAAVGLSRQQAISLDLPKASSGTPQMREMLVVSLDDFGQVYLEKQLVTRNQLLDALKYYHQGNPNGVMVLHASRSATYSEVIQVLDLLKEVGGDRVALATLPGEKESSNNWSYPGVNSLPPGTSLPGGYSDSWQQNLPTNSPELGNSSVPLNPSYNNVPAAPNSP